MGDTRDAHDAVLENLKIPNKETFIAAILQVTRLHASRFACHPILRNICLAQILRARHHPQADEDVLDVLESLRVALWQSLDHDPWVPDEHDAHFREAVSCHGLVYNLEPTTFCVQAWLDASDSENDFS